MGNRASLIQKLISILLTSAFIFIVVIPGLAKHLSFFAVAVVVASIMIISWGLGRLLSGENEWPILIPLVIVIIADAVLFYLIPGAV